MERSVEEVLGRLAIQLVGLGVGVADTDELHERQAVWVRVLAILFDPAPVVADVLSGEQVPVVRQRAVHVVVLRAEVPGLDRPAAWDPDRRVGLLHRSRDRVHGAHLVEASVEGEGLGLGPGAFDQVDRLGVLRAERSGVGAVRVRRVHRGADREAGDDAPTRHEVEHGHLLRDPNRWVVERDRVAEQRDRRSRCARSDDRAEQVR